jgi:hypothetical protein
VAAGAQRPGRRPDPSARTTTRNGKPPRRNTTDPDARVMKTKHHLIVGNNAQAAVTDDQIIVGADLRQGPVDAAALFPDLLDTTIDQATAAGLNPTGTTHADDSADDSADHANSGDDGGDDGGDHGGGGGGGGGGDVASDHDDSPDGVMDVVLADAGYASEKAHLHAEDKGLRLFAPRHKNINPRMIDSSLQPIDPAKLPASARGQQRLAPRRARTTTSTADAPSNRSSARSRPSEEPDPIHPPRLRRSPQRVALQLRRPQPLQVHQPPHRQRPHPTRLTRHGSRTTTRDRPEP